MLNARLVLHTTAAGNGRLKLNRSFLSEDIWAVRKEKSLRKMLFPSKEIGFLLLGTNASLFTFQMVDRLVEPKTLFIFSLFLRLYNANNREVLLLNFYACSCQ